jgi:hypothetical protein
MLGGVLSVKAMSRQLPIGSGQIAANQTSIKRTNAPRRMSRATLLASVPKHPKKSHDSHKHEHDNRNLPQVLHSGLLYPQRIKFAGKIPFTVGNW